ncbi:MAG: NAD(P)H-dependent oxidoreductase [Erysipelotrichaceae bacterium]|nr:NAD(P)H-dependent oxidoreductase [Erysipelotrichaceae bacterium]
MAKTLVTFFSASGTTAKVAGRLAEALSADLYEIVPAVLYTDDDLNWMNKQSRSSLEMSDRSSRPPLADMDARIEDYDVIYVGFPIWWYREPSIIDTFIESYDFSGKKIIPFATSGGSPIGDSGKNIQELAKNAEVAKGKRVLATVGVRELKKIFGDK